MPGLGAVDVNSSQSPTSQPSDHASTAKQIPTLVGYLDTLTPDEITNEVVISVSKAASSKRSKISWRAVAEVLSRIYSKDLPVSSVNTSFKGVESRAKRMHHDTEKRQDFLRCPYTPPAIRGKAKLFSMTDVIGVDPEPKRPKTEVFEQVANDIGKENAELQRTIGHLTTVNKELKHEVESLKSTIEQLKVTHTDENQELEQKIEKLKGTHTDELREVINEIKEAHQREIERLKMRLSTETEKVKQQNSDLSKSLNTTKQQLSNVYHTIGKSNKPKYVMQSIKRKNSHIQKWRTECQKLRQYAKKGLVCKSQIEKKSKKLKSLQTQNSNRKNHAKQAKTKAKAPQVDTHILKESLSNCVKIIKEQNESIHEVENKLLETEEALSIGESHAILTRDPTNKGRINPAIKEASMILQGIGVSEQEVGPAIRTVISTLTDSSLVGKLPSRSSQQRLSSEMHAVAKEQLKEALSEEKDLTLKYDGTTKNGRHIVEVELETKEKTYFIGGRETAGGKASDYVDTIVSVLDAVKPDMLQQVSNTMTDRVVTNSAVDRELGNKKGDKLNSFRCSMHPLDSIHKQCDKFISAHEHTLNIEKSGKYPFQKGGESMTQATLRSIDKLFHDSGCGLPQDLPQFLKSKGIKGGENRSLYPRWVGNRFNIYFVNAGLLYMYEPLIREFQSKVIKPRNNLHHAIFNILSTQQIQPILRALGLVNKFLTGPWMDWQGSRQGILQTSQVFTNVLNTLDGVSSVNLVNGFEETAFGTSPKKDAKYIALTTTCSNDQETAAVLAGLLAEVTAVMRRQLEDHLPGGKYHAPDENIQEAAKSCSMNNISGERVFAKIDSRINKARSASLQKCVNKAQFTINKVPQYLASKSKEEKAEIIRKATTQAQKDRQNEKQWKEELQRAMRKRLDDSRKELERKEQNGRDAKERIIESVLKHGLWNSDEEIDDGVEPLKKTPAITALKEQIRFRTDILGIKHPEGKKVVFTKSTQENLQDYLKELIPVPTPAEKGEIFEIIRDPSAIVGFDFNQKWSTDGVDTMCRGSIISLEKETDEFKCMFDAEQTAVFQTISEIITDIAVGDMFLYIS